MENISKPVIRAEAIEKQLRDARREVKQIRSEYSINGKPVNLVFLFQMLETVKELS